jgi:hypothetical protein
MSQPNEPPLALESWSITVDLNDGTDFKIGAGDIEENIRDEILAIVEDYVERHVDHLKGKYAGEVEDAEDLHAQNSKQFVDYEKK